MKVYEPNIFYSQYVFVGLLKLRDLDEYSFMSLENDDSSLSNSLAGVSYSRTLPAQGGKLPDHADVR